MGPRARVRARRRRNTESHAGSCAPRRADAGDVARRLGGLAAATGDEMARAIASPADRARLDATLVHRGGAAWNDADVSSVRVRAAARAESGALHAGVPAAGCDDPNTEMTERSGRRWNARGSARAARSQVRVPARHGARAQARAWPRVLMAWALLLSQTRLDPARMRAGERHRRGRRSGGGRWAIRRVALLALRVTRRRASRACSRAESLGLRRWPRSARGGRRREVRAQTEVRNRAARARTESRRLRFRFVRRSLRPAPPRRTPRGPRPHPPPHRLRDRRGASRRTTTRSATSARSGFGPRRRAGAFVLSCGPVPRLMARRAASFFGAATRERTRCCRRAAARERDVRRRRLLHGAVPVRGRRTATGCGGAGDGTTLAVHAPTSARSRRLRRSKQTRTWTRIGADATRGRARALPVGEPETARRWRRGGVERGERASAAPERAMLARSRRRRTINARGEGGRAVGWRWRSRPLASAALVRRAGRRRARIGAMGGGRRSSTGRAESPRGVRMARDFKSNWKSARRLVALAVVPSVGLGVAPPRARRADARARAEGRTRAKLARRGDGTPDGEGLHDRRGGHRSSARSTAATSRPVRQARARRASAAKHDVTEAWGRRCATAAFLGRLTRAHRRRTRRRRRTSRVRVVGGRRSRRGRGRGRRRRRSRRSPAARRLGNRRTRLLACAPRASPRRRRSRAIHGAREPRWTPEGQRRRGRSRAARRCTRAHLRREREAARASDAS